MGIPIFFNPLMDAQPEAGPPRAHTDANTPRDQGQASSSSQLHIEHQQTIRSLSPMDIYAADHPLNSTHSLQSRTTTRESPSLSREIIPGSLLSRGNTPDLEDWDSDRSSMPAFWDLHDLEYSLEHSLGPSFGPTLTTRPLISRTRTTTVPREVNGQQTALHRGPNILLEQEILPSTQLSSSLPGTMQGRTRGGQSYDFSQEHTLPQYSPAATSYTRFPASVADARRTHEEIVTEHTTFTLVDVGSESPIAEQSERLRDGFGEYHYEHHQMDSDDSDLESWEHEEHITLARQPTRRTVYGYRNVNVVQTPVRRAPEQPFDEQAFNQSMNSYAYNLGSWCLTQCAAASANETNGYPESDTYRVLLQTDALSLARELDSNDEQQILDSLPKVEMCLEILRGLNGAMTQAVSRCEGLLQFCEGLLKSDRGERVKVAWGNCIYLHTGLLPAQILREAGIVFPGNTLQGDAL